MRLAFLSAAAATVFLAGAQIARADDPAIKQQLQQMYLRADDAIRARDLDRVKAQYADDFTLKLENKKSITLPEVLNLLHWQLVGTKQIDHLACTIRSLTTKGDTVVAVVTQDETMVVVKNKKDYVLKSSQLSEDTWVKTPSGWRLKHQEVKKSTITADGKPVTPVK